MNKYQEMAAELQQMGNEILAKKRASYTVATPKYFTILVECDHIGGYSMRPSSNSARANRFEQASESCTLCGDTGRKSQRIPLADADFIDECAVNEGMTRAEFLGADF